MKKRFTAEQDINNLKLSKPPPTVVENNEYLQQVWTQQQMGSFQDYLCWYNKKDVVPTLEAMQKNAFLSRQRYQYVEVTKLG